MLTRHRNLSMSSNIKYQGNNLGESSRGGGGFRGTRARGLVPHGCQFGRSRGARGARLSSYHSSEEEEQTNSDDSTQPPSEPCVPPCASPIPPPDPIREPSPIREQSPPREVATNEDLRISQTADAPTEPVTNQQQRKRTRGPTKGTLFEKLRKSGKVPLKINDGETAPCCENASMFTTRVSWIIKQYCDMSYARWSAVPPAKKEELIARFKSDFVFDWERENHRLTVTKQLRKRFNAFHHDFTRYIYHMEATKRSWLMGLAWSTHSYGLSYVGGGAATNLRKCRLKIERTGRSSRLITHQDVNHLSGSLSRSVLEIIQRI